MFPLSGNADVSGWDVPVHKLDAVAGLGAEPRKFWQFFACKRTSTVGTSLTGLLVYPAVTLKGSIFRLPRHINSSNKKKLYSTVGTSLTGTLPTCFLAPFWEYTWFWQAQSHNLRDRPLKKPCPQSRWSYLIIMMIIVIKTVFTFILYFIVFNKELLRWLD